MTLLPPTPMPPLGSQHRESEWRRRRRKSNRRRLLLRMDGMIVFFTVPSPSVRSLLLLPLLRLCLRLRGTDAADGSGWVNEERRRVCCVSKQFAPSPAPSLFSLSVAPSPAPSSVRPSLSLKREKSSPIRSDPRGRRRARCGGRRVGRVSHSPSRPTPPSVRRRPSLPRRRPRRTRNRGRRGRPCLLAPGGERGREGTTASTPSPSLPDDANSHFSSLSRRSQAENNAARPRLLLLGPCRLTQLKTGRGERELVQRRANPQTSNHD